MVKATEHRPAPHTPKSRLALRWAAFQRVQSEPAVWPEPVVVSDVFMENPPRVSLAEDDHVVQALSPQRPDRTLGDRVGVLRSYRSELRFDPDTASLGSEVGLVGTVAITDQVRELACPGSRLDELAPDPGRGGVTNPPPRLTGRDRRGPPALTVGGESPASVDRRRPALAPRDSGLTPRAITADGSARCPSSFWASMNIRKTTGSS